MKSPFRLFASLLVLAIIASLVLACGGGTTTPPATTPTTTTPTTTPPATTPTTTTPTTTPTPATTPTTAAYSYSAKVFGEDVTISTDARGAMLEPFEKTSPDGTITISFQKGTKITNVDLVPYKQFSATIDPNPTQPADGPTVIGPAVTFNPRDARIFPAMSYQFNYTGFQARIDQIPDAEVFMGFLLSRGDWAKYSEFQVNAAAKTASVNLELFVPVALLAQTPKQVQQATGVPANGVDVTIVSMEGFSPGMDTKLTINTVPNARVLIWLVLPNTGTRSSRPGSDRLKLADASGNATWSWNTHSDTAVGEGRIEIYVTTSTDPAVLAAFDGYFAAGSASLENYFTAKATDIVRFKKGEIAQLELDDHTTLKMFPVTYK